MTLRRLKVLGIVLPVLFVVALELVRLTVIEKGFADYAPHIVLAAVTVLAVVAFSFVMFHFIARAHAETAEAVRQHATLAERERLACELHDSLAQVLGAVHLRLRGLASSENGVAPAIALELIELADTCEEGYGDARGAILELHESSRAERGLLDSLRIYLDKYSRQCGIAASLQTSLEHDLALPPRSEVQIVRVVQEALANVRKHSGAATATVRVSERNGTIVFAVQDDGRGFEASEELFERGGFGLHSMRERMESIGGTLLTDSARGRGTRIVAELPGAQAPAGAHSIQTPAPPIPATPILSVR